MIVIKTDSEIGKMRKAGKMVALAHQRVRESIREGITTGELDRIVTEFLTANGAVPAFKGYRGFPASICASVNDEVVHGIPGDRVLQAGDIVGVDIGAIVDGYFGDSAWSYPVGEIGKEAAKLLEVAEASLYSGIEAARTGNRLSDISHAIQTRAESAGFSVVRDFVGHGIGRQMHEEPQVPNFGRPGRGPRLRKGMTLALEPMINFGGHEVKILGDNWTVVTEDGSLSAHFEHTIAITEAEAEILTL